MPHGVTVAVPVALLSAYHVPAAGRHTARFFWSRGGGDAAYPAVQHNTTLSHRISTFLMFGNPFLHVRKPLPSYVHSFALLPVPLRGVPLLPGQARAAHGRVRLALPRQADQDPLVEQGRVLGLP